MRILVFFLLLLSTASIQAQHKKSIVSWNQNIKGDSLIEAQEKNWEHLDIEKDTIPGISLDRVYKELLEKEKRKETIVALIDTEIDINQAEINKILWLNIDEIPNNNIDDDNNGYVDDIHGWNFMGNSEGENIIIANNEATRIVRYYQTKAIAESIEDSILINNQDYKKAKFIVDKELKSSLSTIKRGKVIIEKYKNAMRLIGNNYADDMLTIEFLDSIKLARPEITEEIKAIYKWKNIGYDLEILENDFNSKKNIVDYYYNIHYNERSIQGDDPENLSDNHYGNNLLTGNLGEFYHGTQIASVLKSVVGENTSIKILPIPSIVNGEIHDKDLALSIYYAVNNGAKIINLSAGKYFSLHSDWVQEAISYALDKDVLFVFAAGNSKLNIDINDNMVYPKRTKYNSNSIIRVGASGKYIDNKLATFFSNYGKQEVDIFAPGHELPVLNPYNEHLINSGTSLSTAIVSGVAALIRSYYPSLTASEVKQILMDSAVKYDILVDVPTKENPEQQLPFSELSKSGGIVNAYNAMLMAEEYVKKKK
ncbi:S8 family serine peptidase [uncultured Dokdonia sp.]|uniref:S8 family serine peptidase n=1 Tax=uncultured Dokdonia sp. TaxID=575653 RepID=UPI00260DD23D|nr:S8 family serine peptidase [uncultured Dokdonia sp.]